MEQLWWDFSIWLLLALIASLISVRLAISVALVEIIVGVIAGNTIHPPVIKEISFLAGFGAIILTFLAGAELESEIIKKYWKHSLVIGSVGFICPFIFCYLISHYILGWTVKASLISGLSLSTTSVAVVYTVLLESGLNRSSVGKLLLCSCFINDLIAVIVLGFLFSTITLWFWIFIAVMIICMILIPAVTPLFLKTVGTHVSEGEIKYLYLILIFLAFLAIKGGSEGVLPAYLMGMVLADIFLANKEMIRRMRATTFALLTPFFFLKTGSLVDIKTVIAGIGLVALFFFSGVLSKFTGIFTTGLFFKFKTKFNIYKSLIMCAGLTFGAIVALHGYEHKIIGKNEYSLLIVVIILTAVIPTLIAQEFFMPSGGEEND